MDTLNLRSLHILFGELHPLNDYGSKNNSQQINSFLKQIVFEPKYHDHSKKWTFCAKFTMLN